MQIRTAQDDVGKRDSDSSSGSGVGEGEEIGEVLVRRCVVVVRASPPQTFHAQIRSLHSCLATALLCLPSNLHQSG
jgi:hypothetical protein